MKNEMKGLTPDLIEIVTCKSRLVPQPMKWNDLWQMIQKRVPAEQGSTKLLPPLILAGWNFSGDEEKRDRFLHHLEWACMHGIEQPVADYLARLKDNDWYTGEPQ